MPYGYCTASMESVIAGCSKIHKIHAKNCETCEWCEEIFQMDHGSHRPALHDFEERFMQTPKALTITRCIFAIPTAKWSTTVENCFFSPRPIVKLFVSAFMLQMWTVIYFKKWFNSKQKNNNNKFIRFISDRWKRFSVNLIGVRVQVWNNNCVDSLYEPTSKYSRYYERTHAHTHSSFSSTTYNILQTYRCVWNRWHSIMQYKLCSYKTYTLHKIHFVCGKFFSKTSLSISLSLPLHPPSIFAPKKSL